MSDATLARLEAKFNASSDRWDAATDNTDKIERLAERVRARREKAEESEQRDADAVETLFDQVMNARATTLAGLLVKVRVRDRWSTDDEQSEIAILHSLVADLKAMGEKL